ncbi:response regulator [Chryseobacterium sp. G0162]|uniref:response regulator n=1 Tax=Chryseobacterium sp. G0162 TaxID=2487063 RepID=UPI000F4E4780|nr:response regulator [Chryseobacterium sp. G0162]AZB07342.1 response regulator [Chryseobacterium sp. G0162]
MANEDKKIFICDDDQGILDVLEIILESQGYMIFKEIDSTLLFNKLKEEKGDLLLLDLWMPVLSGHELINIIRKDPQTKKLPIIVLSASRNEKDMALNAGANQFISKPFDMDEIITSVEKIIK